jgi:hypothetical protein
MTKAPSPLLGYNNNVRHKNRVFHVQTEDSGVKHPHIITHLFMDGGRILKSTKQSYAEFVGTEGMADVVRNMMKEQHKAMLIALRDGQFDDLVDPKGTKPNTGARPSGPGAASPASGAGAPASVSAASAAAASAPVAASVPAEAKTVAVVQAPAKPALPAASATTAQIGQAKGKPEETPGTTARAAQAKGKPEAPATTAHAAQAKEKPEAPATTAHTEQAKGKPEDPPPTTRNPRQPSAELTLDIDALERAAEDAEGASPMFAQQNDLPPPPQNLLREKVNVTGSYRALTPPPEAPPADRTTTTASAQRPGSAVTVKKSGPPPKPSSQPPRHMPPLPGRPPAKPAPAGRPGDGRYAPARPAAIFGQARPQSSPTSSLFGEDLISDKSLDEVILSYLAEDLEPTEKKKP